MDGLILGGDCGTCDVTSHVSSPHTGGARDPGAEICESSANIGWLEPTGRMGKITREREKSNSAEAWGKLMLGDRRRVSHGRN